MTPKEAYEVLGLEPLDDFITSRAQDNPSYRCIGASTWMCVRVVLGLAKGEDALVVAPSLERGRPLRDLIGVYARRLFALNPRQRRPDLLDFGKAKVAFSGQANVVGRAGFPGTRFSDEDWKRRAIRRAQGPFAMVRVIRRETDISGNVHFYGYAEEDEYIMELTPEGAANLLEKMRTPPWS